MVAILMCSACSGDQRIDGSPTAGAGPATTTDPPDPPSTTAEPTTENPPETRQAAPPPELVGEWSASTAETGKLELAIEESGAFHHYDGQRLDARGTVAVRGTSLEFHYTDGTTDILDWSLSGGTLVLAGITYLRTSGNGGIQALAGEWIGYDDIYETLVFDAGGGFTRKHEVTGPTSGTFTVRGEKLTVTLSDGTSSTMSWSIEDATLTLVDADGTARQYTRLS